MALLNTELPPSQTLCESDVCRCENVTADTVPAVGTRNTAKYE